ncbi:hypothetical protein WN943_024782 [Citrus x changshan-huyou]
MAWSNLSKNLISQIEQIEGGLRLMVRALIGRIKKLAPMNTLLTSTSLAVPFDDMTFKVAERVF